MKYIIVDMETIISLNVFEDKKLSPVKNINGVLVLCSDILTDEKTWGYAFEYLKGCQQIELTVDDFPKPILIIL